MSPEPDQQRLDHIGDLLVDAIGRSQRRARRLYRASLVVAAAAVLGIGWVGLISLTARSGTDAASQSPAASADSIAPPPEAGVGVPPDDDTVTGPAGGPTVSTGSASGSSSRPAPPSTTSPPTTNSTSISTSSSMLIPPSLIPSTSLIPSPSTSSSSIPTSSSSSSTTISQSFCVVTDPVAYAVQNDPVVDGGPTITDWPGVTLTGTGVDGRRSNLVEDRFGIGVDGGRWPTALDLGNGSPDVSEMIVLRFSRPQCSVAVTLRRLSEATSDRPGDVARLVAVANDGTEVATVRASRTSPVQADETFTVASDQPFRSVRVSVVSEIGGFWVSGVSFDRVGLVES